MAAANKANKTDGLYVLAWRPKVMSPGPVR
jgi:hypothetical protein